MNTFHFTKKQARRAGFALLNNGILTQSVVIFVLLDYAICILYYGMTNF
jgi:hypothetical protein